jgi:predicted nucleic acid-binding protein
MSAMDAGQLRLCSVVLGDLVISAIALANGCTVVTHNLAEFQRVPGLMVEDWRVSKQ